jgi:deoxyribodipyrimidine photolyase-related protein
LSGVISVSPPFTRGRNDNEVRRLSGVLSVNQPYQDAMVTGEQTMWYAMLSPYLNIGLLHPLEVVQAAEQAYHANRDQWELNSIEGFVRQIIGWREYMHGIYVYMGEDYPDRNWFNHTQPLPDFYWTGETNMNCLHHILNQVKAKLFSTTFKD